MLQHNQHYVVAILLIWSGCMKSVVKKLWEYLGGINGLLLIIYSVFVFSTAIVTSSNFSKIYFIISEMLITVLSVIVCPIIIRFILKISIICNFLRRYIYIF